MRKKNKKLPPNVTATVNLTILDKPLHLEITVPVSPTRPVKMLPVFRSMAKSFVNLAVDNAGELGKEVSCKKGCAACCRQLIPVTQIEAHRILGIVNAMPEPRKSAVIKRFEEVKQRMLEIGLLEKLANPEQIADEEYRDIGLKYFAEYIDCPFLEEETCIIHSERPFACLEYLVVSPAENCKRKSGEPVEVLNIPGKMLKALGSFNINKKTSWIPLILALEWAEANPDESSASSGTEILRELFKELTGKNIPKSTI
jgi:Fe-S-cluster containining protein